MEQAVVLIAPKAAAHARGEDTRSALTGELQALRKALLTADTQLLAARPGASSSERNLARYLCLRGHDHCGLQERLAELGLSSLGQAKADVLANVDKVLQRQHRVRARDPRQQPMGAPTANRSGQALHRRSCEALFGRAPEGRRACIMVTLPTDAATDVTLIPALVQSGMDVARINCAHDDAEVWIAMATRVRRAAAAAGRPVRVLMDLAGPKLCTGPVEPGPQVLKLKPQRDAYGAVTAPARLLLCTRIGTADGTYANNLLEVDVQWLSQLRTGDCIRLVDARAHKRRLHVVEERPDGVVVECERTAYLRPGTTLVVHRPNAESMTTTLRDMPAQPGRLHLNRGQTLRLSSQGLGRDAQPHLAKGRDSPAQIACTRPEVLGQLREGERVWFDDGRIGGVIRSVAANRVDIEVTDAAPGGETLGADRCIHLPDSHLDLPAVTNKDLADLAVAARYADLVGMSCAQSAADVHALQRRLAELCASHLGVLLKVGTRRGFENLPELLFAAMSASPAGVMIARGELAVECGFKRVAEVQQEVLRLCEAAHMPVVWATQVLSDSAKTGRPSRAEITDAAMGVRTDCVMLDEGPHILEAMCTLDAVLRRLHKHQSKEKKPPLRALRGAGSDTCASTPDSAKVKELVRDHLRCATSRKLMVALD